MIDWRHWHNEPYLIGGLILTGWLYALATGPLRERLAPGQSYDRWRAISFYGSLLLFYLAVGSPLDQIGERFLFSAHMAQHTLLIYPVAVLWIAGLPPWMVDVYATRGPGRQLAGFMLRPMVCALSYIIVQSAWHVPDLYDLALRDRLVHVLEHVMFFGTALMFWWPVMNPSTVWPPLKHGSRMIYLILVGVGLTPLFAYITFSPDVLYPTYEFAPRLIPNFSPAQDQLLAGAIMKLGSVTVTFIALAVVFYRWYRTSEGPLAATRPAR